MNAQNLVVFVNRTVSISGGHTDVHAIKVSLCDMTTGETALLQNVAVTSFMWRLEILSCVCYSECYVSVLSIIKNGSTIYLLLVYLPAVDSSYSMYSARVCVCAHTCMRACMCMHVVLNDRIISEEWIETNVEASRHDLIWDIIPVSSGKLWG